MGLLDTALADGRCWSRVGDCFEVTRKPPGLRVADYKAVPFVPMEAIPQGGQYEPRYDQKPGADITSGTYFERGDLLIAKITPSFENGKQAWVKRLPAPFGYATTEVIPLRPTAAGYDRRLLFFYLLHPEIRSYVSERMEGSTGRQRVPEQVLLDLPYPKLPPDDQQAIADTLERVTLQVDLEEHSARTAAELKRAAMRELFTRGLRGEPQKETEIGPVPESWQVTSLEAVAIVRGGTSFPPALQGKHQGAFPFYKVSDMNLPGNELEMRSAANWIDRADLEQLRAKPFPRETIIFPKVGGALHTNKKRLLIRDALVDNNIMGVTIIENVPCRPKYLFAWFQTINLSSIANAGPLPSINSSQLYELKLPLPDLAEQDDIIAILDAIDRKIELHRKKRAVLEELFKALLHKLMTGEVRVDALDLSALQAHAGPVSPAAEPAV